MDCIYKKNIKRIATIGFKKVFVLHSLPPTDCCKNAHIF